MNNNLFSVMQSPRGTLSIVNQQSIDYWEMSQQGYETLETGGKRHCEDYLAEYMSEHYLVTE